jgi:hypothetical protein
VRARNRAIPNLGSTFLVAAIVVAMTMFAVDAKSQARQPALTTPLDPLRPGISENQLFAELATRNERRSAGLLGYTSLRTYKVVDLKGKVHAEEVGRMDYHAPDKKTFVVTSEKGSALIRYLALNPLIASEIETASGKEHHDSAIIPANYNLELIGEQQIGPYRCFVARATPKRRDKYLFEGKVWIDAQDFAVVRIEGHPAKKLSFWIEQVDFVRQYQKIGGFWLPQRDETLVQVRLYGKKTLTIDHQDYSLNPTFGKDQAAENVSHF